MQTTFEDSVKFVNSFEMLFTAFESCTAFARVAISNEPLFPSSLSEDQRQPTSTGGARDKKIIKEDGAVAKALIVGNP